MFSSLYGVAPPTSIIYLAWNSGTPGSVAQVFTDYSAYGSFTPGGQSWQPANGDKYIFPPYYGGSPFTLPPGGLVVSQPYYIVNTHAGPISGMSWASGTLTVTTPAHRIPVASTVVMGINGNTSVGGIYGTNLHLSHSKYDAVYLSVNPCAFAPPNGVGRIQHVADSRFAGRDATKPDGQWHILFVRSGAGQSTS